MRFFIDVDKQAAFCRDEDFRENGATGCWASAPGGVGLSDYEYRHIFNWLSHGARELTAAEFLEETRGNKIADKALEMLAAERGVRCFTDSTHRIWWACGTHYRLCLDDDGHSRIPGWKPNDDDVERQRWVTEVDLPNILSSEPGKKHRKAIEAFILGLPVVSHETPVGEKQAALSSMDETQERTLFDVVRSMTFAPMCEQWRKFLGRPASEWAVAFDEAYANVEYDTQDFEDWVYTHLGVDSRKFRGRNAYKLAIARKLGLVADKPVAAENASAPQATTHTLCDVVKTLGVNNEDVSELIIASHTLRKLGWTYASGVWSPPERGDYALIGCSAESNWPDIEKILHHVSREEAEGQLRALLMWEHGATLSLRPLGPPIKTLRSVERTTYEIEEVTGEVNGDGNAEIQR